MCPRRVPRIPQRWGTVILALGMLLGACAGDQAEPRVGAQAASDAAGSLVCAEARHDFGEVWQGAVLEHEFMLEMQAEKPGGVVSVRADCGCAVTELEVQMKAGAEREPYTLKTPLPKGARLFVHVTYDTSDKSGPAPRSISVFGPGGVLRLGLEVKLQPWLSISPELAQVGLLEESASASASYVIKSLTGEPFGLSYERFAIPDEVSVRLEAQEPGADGRSGHWIASVTLGAGMPRGKHTYPIKLTSDRVIGAQTAPAQDAGAPTHRVASLLSVNVVGPVSINPDGMSFGVLQPDETVAKSVRLVCHDSQFSLQRPQVSFEPLPGDEVFALGKTAQVSLKAVPGEAAWDIQLLLSGLDPGVNDNFLGRLVIQTGHPEQPVLQALVKGVRMPMGG